MFIPEWIFKDIGSLGPPEPKKNINLSADERQRRQTLINEAKLKWDTYLAYYNGTRPGPGHSGVSDWKEPPSVDYFAEPEPESSGPPPQTGEPQAAGKLKGQPPDPVKLLSCSEIKARCNKLQLSADGKYTKCYKRVSLNSPPFGFSSDKPALDTRDGYKYSYVHPDVLQSATKIPSDYIDKYYPDHSGYYEDGFKVVSKCIGPSPPDEPEETQGTESEVLDVLKCNLLKDKGIANLSFEENQYYQKCKATYPDDYN